LLHSRLSYYNMHFNYIAFTYFFALILRVRSFKDFLVLFNLVPWSTWVYFMLGRTC
jgi:hypothetical protein